MLWDLDGGVKQCETMYVTGILKKTCFAYFRFYKWFYLLYKQNQDDFIQYVVIFFQIT